MTETRPALHKTHERRAELRAGFLYRIVPKSENKCAKYGYKYIYDRK